MAFPAELRVGESIRKWVSVMEVSFPDYIVKMSDEVREFIANRDCFKGSDQEYESQLKALRDRVWLFESAYEKGYKAEYSKSFLVGLQIGHIHGLQFALNVRETDTDQLAELTETERAEIHESLKEKYRVSQK